MCVCVELVFTYYFNGSVVGGSEILVTLKTRKDKRKGPYFQDKEKKSIFRLLVFLCQVPRGIFLSLSSPIALLPLHYYCIKKGRRVVRVTVVVVERVKRKEKLFASKREREWLISFFKKVFEQGEKSTYRFLVHYVRFMNPSLRVAALELLAAASLLISTTKRDNNL